jgi:hypothetical protein
MKNKKVIIRCLIGFLAFAAVITYVSRTVYVWSLPRVALAFAEPGVFTRAYEMWGVVTLTDEYPGYEAVADLLVPASDLPPIHDAFVSAGRTLFLEIMTIQYAQFNGTVLSVRIDGEGAHIRAGFNIEPLDERAGEMEIRGGEDIWGKMFGVSYAYDCVVPSSAVRQDREGAYVLTVREERGVMGREFAAARYDVFIIDELFGRTAVSTVSGDIEEPVVISADVAVSAGDRVRFYP